MDPHSPPYYSTSGGEHTLHLVVEAGGFSCPQGFPGTPCKFGTPSYSLPSGGASSPSRNSSAPNFGVFIGGPRQLPLMSGPAQPLPVDDAGLPEEVREIVAKARSSWLKNSEVFQILQHATSGLLPLSTSPPELPPGEWGSLPAPHAMAATCGLQPQCQPPLPNPIRWDSVPHRP